MPGYLLAPGPALRDPLAVRQKNRRDPTGSLLFFDWYPKHPPVLQGERKTSGANEKKGELQASQKGLKKIKPPGIMKAV